MSIKITHVTSAHDRYSTRIFLKMCSSLAKNGYHTSLVVADGLGNERKNDVAIIDAGKRANTRLSRMTKTVDVVYKFAKAENADIYHLHDPELLAVAVKLKKLGKTVIFDSHEDVPKQILGKAYLHPVIRVIVSKIFLIYEKFICKQLDGVITATPFIRDKFLKINSNTIDINNFPIRGEFKPISSWNNKLKKVCYIGGIEEIRGIKETVMAMEKTTSDARLLLAGSFTSKSTKDEVKNYSGWQYVDELGYLDREGVKKTLEQSVAGIVTLHPIINYIDALPVKMFEYMGAGIPVIASNFPLWKEIIETNHCGVCVDPMNPKEISDAIDFFISNPKNAQEMGEKGYDAVNNKYNWEIEEKKMIGFYEETILK